MSKTRALYVPRDLHDSLATLAKARGESMRQTVMRALRREEGRMMQERRWAREEQES